MYPTCKILWKWGRSWSASKQIYLARSRVSFSLSPPFFFEFFFLLTFLDQPLLTCRVVFLRIKTPSFVWTLCYCGKIWVAFAFSLGTMLQGVPLNMTHGSVSLGQIPGLRAKILTFLAPGTGRQFFHGLGLGDGLVSGWFHYIYCALHFYYYYISSTSDHQALDPGGWRPVG